MNAVGQLLGGAGYLTTTVEEDQKMEQSQQSAPSNKGSPEKNEDEAGCLILNPSSLKAEDYQTDDSLSQGGGSDCNSVEHEYGPA